MAAAGVEGFLPSANGFHFSNSWPHQPVVSIPVLGRHINLGDAANGLCGGMAFAARDFFEAGLPVPRTATTPALHTPLYDYLVRRMFASFDLPAGVGRFFAWQLPTRDQLGATVRQEWPKIKSALEAGRLVALGLVRARSFRPGELARNHQVLAYGYDLDPMGRVTLHVYDPNNPDNDRVTVSFPADSREAEEMTYAVGGAAAARGSHDFTYGCFVQKYRPSSPLRVVDPRL
jgi:hypothetical protein